HPMHPGRLRMRGIGRVGVVDDEGEAPGSLRHAGPLERWRDVVPLAGVEPGDLLAVFKGGGGDGECHFGSSSNRCGALKDRHTGPSFGSYQRSDTSGAVSASAVNSVW